jgi:hypothetical protein
MMRVGLASAMVLTLVGAAAAKPAPSETPRLTPRPADLAIATGAAGAMIESDYFHAPGGQFSGHGVLACRLQAEMFSKIRLAKSCN